MGNYTKAEVDSPDELMERLGVKFDRVFSWSSEAWGRGVYVFAVKGEGEKTKIIAHGYGQTEEEAVASMVPCKHPRAKVIKAT